MAAVVNYSPPWWVNLLHRLPHFNMEFQIVSSDFRPEDSEYQKVRQPPVGGIITPTRNASYCATFGITLSHLPPPAHAVVFTAKRPNGGESCPQTTELSRISLRRWSVGPKTSLDHDADPVPILLPYHRTKCGSVGGDQNSFRNCGVNEESLLRGVQPRDQLVCTVVTLAYTRMSQSFKPLKIQHRPQNFCIETV